MEKISEIPSQAMLAKKATQTSSSETMICKECRDAGFTSGSISYQAYGSSDKYFCRHCAKGENLFEQWKKEPAQQKCFRAWKQDKIDRAIRISGVDGVFQNIRLNDIKSESSLAKSCIKYVENWEEIRLTGEGYYFWGNVGAGKTFIASALANELMKAKLVEVLFIRMPEAAKRVKKSFDSFVKNEDKKLFDRMKDVELLVIDDLGVEKVSEWLIDEMYQIIDFRWRNKKPMIITSNRSLDDLSKVYPEQIPSRIKGCCKNIHFKASDKRQNAPTLF